MTTHLRPSRRLATSIALSVLGLAAHSPSAFAATLTWTGGTNAFWGNVGNWSTGAVPAASADVLFDVTSGQFTVNLGANNRTVASLTIDSATAYTISNPQGVWLAPGDVTVASGTGHTFATTINLADGTTPTYEIASGADLTISGVIDEYEGGTAGLTKTGDGTLIFTADNLYDGTTTITAGTLQLGDGGTAGSVAGDIAIGSDGTLVFNRSDTTTYAGALSGTGDLTKEGTGTLMLSGASTFSGTTTVNAGTLALSGDHRDALANSAVTLGTAGSFHADDGDSNYDTFEIGSLAGSGTVILGYDSLEVGGNDTDAVFSGTIDDSGNDVELSKVGAGTLTFAGATFDLYSLAGAGGELVLDGGTGLIDELYSDGGKLTVRNVGAELTIPSFSNFAETLITGAATKPDFSQYISNSGRLTIDDGASVAASNSFYQESDALTVVDQASLRIGHFRTAPTGHAAGTISISDSTSGGPALTLGNDEENSTFAGVIEDYTSGPGSVTKVGTATIILTGDNTYTGGTTISVGKLQLGDGGTTGSLVGDVANAGTLAVNRSNDLTLAGTLSGTGGLTQDGAGTLTLTANNTYTGGTTITGGTLQLGNGGTTGTVAGDIANDGALVVNRSNDFTFAGVITGTGSLTKEGAGTLTLTGNSTFSGDTVINGGAINLDSSTDPNDQLKNSTVWLNVDNGLVSRNGVVRLGGLAGGGSPYLVFNYAELYVGYNNEDTVYSGNIAGIDTVHKDGTGTWTLTGTNLDFTNIAVDQGSLVLDGATGSISSIISTGDSVALQNGADITTTSVDLASRLTVTGAGTALTVTGYSHNRGGWLVEDGASLVTGDLYDNYGETITVNQGALTIKSIVQSDDSSPIQIGDATGGTALTFDLASDATFAGVISDYSDADGTVSGSMLKSGAGTLTLTADNTYTGGTTISAGTLQLGNGGTTGAIVGDVVNNGTLAVNRSNDLTLGAVTGTGALTKDGAGTLTLTGEHTYTGTTTLSAGTLEFAGDGTTASLAGTISGAGALAKDGTGTLILTANNTYSGGTTISAGTLQLGNGGSTGTVAGAIVNDGALVLDRSNFFSFGNVISGTGSLEQAGSGFTILTAANTFSGATTVTGGTLLLGNALALQNSTLTLDGAGTFDFNGTDATLGGLAGSRDLSLGAQAITVGQNGDDTTYAGILSGTGSLTKTGAGTLTLSGDNTYSGGTTISAGTLQLGDGGTTGSILGDVANAGTLAFNHSDNLTFAGAISGTGGVTQNGTGVLSLTGATTFTGDLTLNAGQVLLGSATEFASNTVVNNTTDGLDLNGFDATLGGLSGSGDLALGAQTLTVGGNGTPTTYAGALSGTGGLTKTGAGTLVLSGANTYSGGTTISAGTLQLGNAGASGSIQGDVANAGTLVFNRSDTSTHGGVISGTGAVQQVGSGTTILTAANTYTGGTTIGTGTLQIGDGGTTGSITGNVTTATGTTLAFDRSDDLTYSGVVSGGGGLTQAGTGTLILTANQTFTGDTTIETGATLQLGNTSGSGIVSGDIVNDGALIISRSNNLTYGGVISGSGSLTKAGGGTLTLSGDSTFTGATTVDAGTLTLSVSGRDALANSAVTIGTGATLTMYDPDGATFSAASLAGSGTFNLGNHDFDVGSNNADTTFSGTIIAADSNNDGIVNKYGAGTLTFAGADINAGFVVNNGEVVLDGTTGTTGLTTESGGKLTVKNVGAGLATIALNNDGETLVTGDGTALNLSLYIYNAGQLTIDAGASLDAADYFQQEAGATTVVDQASLSFGYFSGGATGTISLSDPTGGGSALTFGRDGSDTSTFAGVIEDYTSGPGSVTKVGTNTIVLTGANTYTGGTTISAGTLQLGNGGTTGSLVGDVANDGTLVFKRSDETTFAGTISGSGSVQQTGTGTTILTADHTYTGGTTISAGTLQLGDGGTTGSIALDQVTLAGGTLAFNRSDDITLGNVLSGGGGLTQAGTGTLTLTANNTYTGTTTIETGGTLQLGNGGTTGTVAGDIANDGALVVNRSNNFTLAGVISGTGSLTKEGAGTLSLTGQSTFSGDTVINGGAIKITVGDYPLKNSTVELNVDDGLVLDSSDVYHLGALAGSGNITLGSDSASLYVGYNNTDTVYSGNISGGDTVYKEGTGTWTLTGTNHDVTTLQVDQGSLVLDGARGLIRSVYVGGGSVTLQNGADIATSTDASFQSLLTITGSGTSLSVADTLTNRGGVLVQDGGKLQVGALYSPSSQAITVKQATLTIKDVSASDQTGSIQIGDPTGGTALTFDLASDATFAGVISDYSDDDGTISGSVLKTGAGALTLSAANTHSGTTTISGGQIVLGNALALQNSTVSIDVADGLDLNGTAATLGGLAGSGNLALGSQALTVGGNGNSTTYAGVLSGTGGSLTKAGDGTLVLTGDNTYTGGTTIDGGTLQLGDGGTTGIVAGDIVNNGTLVFDRSNAVTVSGVISGTGDLAFTGSNTTTLNAANTFTGTTTIESGFVTLGKILALQNSTVDLSRSYSLNLNNNHATLGALKGSGNITVTGGHTLVVGGNDADTLYSGAIQSGGSLRKQGDGTMILTGNNSYSGGTTINEGTLQIGDGGTTGVLPGDVANNAALVFNRSDALTYAGVISGTGSLTQAGAGTLTLSAASTFTGTTTINAGAINLYDSDYLNSSLQNSTVEVNVDGGLKLADAGAARLGALRGSGDVDMADNGAEVFVGGNGADTTYSGNFTNGSFELIHKEGTGTWTLNGTGLDFYGLEVNAGNVVLDGAAGTLGRITGDSGTTTTFQNGSQLTVTGGMSGGSLTVTGAGTALSVANNLDGYSSLRVEDGGHLTASILTFDSTTPVIVDAATLTIGGISGSAPASSLQISDPTGGTALIFDVANNINYSGTISDYASGSGSILKTGAGTVTLSGTNTYTGDTMIDEGAINLSTGDYINYSLQNSTVEINVDGGLTLADAGAARLGALSGTGNVDMANNGAEVFVGGNGADTTYSGNFINGSFELIHKEGAGTWTLNGTGLDFYGLEVNAGSVVFDGAVGTLGRIANDAGTSVTFQSGAQITLSSVLTGGALTVTGTGTELSVASNLSGYSSLRVEDGGHLTASLLTFDSTTPVIVDAATLTIGGIASSAPASSLQISDPTGGTALIFDVTNDTNFSGSISDYTSGPGSVAKTGTGTVRLGGTNTFSGGTTISAGTISADSGTSLGTGAITFDGGTLALTAATSLSQAITVNSGGGAITASGAVTLSGDLTVDGTFAVSNGLILDGVVDGGGSFTGAVTVNGTLSPGHSPGTLTFDDNLTLGDGSTLRIEIGGLSQGTGYDFVSVGGAATLGGTLEVVWYDGFTASAGDTFTFLTAAGGVSGSFSSTALPMLTGGLDWNYTQSADSLYLTVTSAVPEPASWGALAGLAALGATTLRRRRRTDMADCRPAASKPVRQV